MTLESWQREVNRNGGMYNIAIGRMTYPAPKTLAQTLVCTLLCMYSILYIFRRCMLWQLSTGAIISSIILHAHETSNARKRESYIACYKSTVIADVNTAIMGDYPFARLRQRAHVRTRQGCNITLPFSRGRAICSIIIMYTPSPTFCVRPPLPPENARCHRCNALCR